MDHIKNILALQEAETIIDSIRSDAQIYPDRLAEVQKEYDEKKRVYDEAQTRKSALEAERADLQHTLELEQQRLEKSKKKMKDLTKQYEVQAMKKEIESTERSNDELETKILEKGEEIDQADQALSKMEETLNEVKGRLDEAQKEVDEKMGEFDGLLEDKLSIKKELEEKCDPSILSSYRMIRDRKYQDALVPVVGGACQGCFMNIPPQMANLMMQNPSQLEKCPNCQRLIYWQDEVQEEAAGA